MSSPELHRRVDRQEEDLRATFDTLLDVQETVHGLADVQGQHTETLARHERILEEHSRDLTEIKATVAGHTADLTELKSSVAEILALLRDR